MNAGELKTIVAELKRNIELGEDPQSSIVLVTKLTATLSVLDNEQTLLPKMMEPIKEIINKFWRLAMRSLPLSAWQHDITLVPWLNFQRLLAKANLLERDFHHLILYQALKDRYDTSPNNQLKITVLLSLLTRTSRMLGYAEREEHDRYPLLILHELLKARRPQEAEKIKDIIFLLRSIFYLIHRYCTVEQLNLLPSLIFFRYHTTDEERRSELAIFNWVTRNTPECLAFFRAHNDFIDTRALKSIDALQRVAHLIPTGRNDFFKETDESRWIYRFVHESRIQGTRSRIDLLDETLRLLQIDFATKRDKSLGAVLDFVTSVKRQMRTLTHDETRLVHSAIHLFALDQYIDQRSEDLRNKHSFLSFSRATKCHAAEKIKLAIYGRPAKLNFFETLAASQGRLKRFIEPLESFEEGTLVLSIN